MTEQYIVKQYIVIKVMRMWSFSQNISLSKFNPFSLVTMH